MKYYVVADVHGFYSILKTTLEEKGYFKDKDPHKLIICGDIFDRGNETLEMQAFISDLIDKDEVILIRGNHEDLMVELVQDLEAGFGKSLLGVNYSNGTTNSLMDLTNSDLVETKFNPKSMPNKFYNTDFYKKILPKMLNYYETQNYIFVHGWIPCFEQYVDYEVEYKYQQNWRDAELTQWEQARWINGMFAASQGTIEPNKTIVCGHWHASYGHAVLEGKGKEFDKQSDFSPYYAKGIIAIDACTAYSKKINCIVIEDDDSIEITARKILKEHKRAFEELANR